MKTCGKLITKGEGFRLICGPLEDDDLDKIGVALCASCEVEAEKAAKKSPEPEEKKE